jgi:hypothetical protein
MMIRENDFLHDFHAMAQQEAPKRSRIADSAEDHGPAIDKLVHRLK